MTTLRAQSEPDAEATLQLDVLARRSMAILCLVYLVLGLANVIHFLSTDFADLTGQVSASMEALAAAQAKAETAAPGMLEAATGELDAARAAVMRGWGRLAGLTAGLLIVAYFFLYQRARVRTRQEVTNAVTLMILLLGVVLLASRLVLQKAIPNLAALGIIDLVVLHLAACIFMPWTARESILTFTPLLLVWAVTFLVPNAMGMDIVDRVVGVIISPVVLLPGAALASWRRRRLQERAERLVLGQRVQSFGGELSRARIVHEAMFPRPFTGPVAFEYEYQPIQEIGGDYVHVRVCPETGRVILTLLDVAGHGLPAALTVNRLFGELERILAENTAAEPAEVMILLNRYINLTMAHHSLYATGACLMLDPNSGELKWVSAGHPPALIRHQDRQVTDLPTTTLLLGAVSPEEFDPKQQQRTIRPGDVVITYTDGAFEARDGRGERFGIERLRQTVRFDPPPRSWAKFIAHAVARHHEGQAEDDVLIAALTLRSLRVADEGEPQWEDDAAVRADA